MTFEVEYSYNGTLRDSESQMGRNSVDGRRAQSNGFAFGLGIVDSLGGT
jgi:hypothetical protein